MTSDFLKLHIKRYRSGCCSKKRKIIKNEKYKGDLLQGKTFTVDPITHRRLENMGEEQKYFIEKNHEAIIDERK